MDDQTTTELSLEDQVARLQKDLTDANRSKDYWYSQLSSVQSEISQVHQLLNNLPDGPARQTNEEYPQNLDLITRLAIYFAIRK